MRGACLLAGCLLLAGCDQSMHVQPKNSSYSSSTLWADGTSARPLPAHAVARGDLVRDAAIAMTPPVTAAFIARGRERYDIYCSPCHGLGGHGDGMIVQRGFPAPPDYGSSRLRAAPASHLFDVMTNGYGVMYSYAARVEPGDRWAIVAYIRALQTSQGASSGGAPPAGRTP